MASTVLTGGESVSHARGPRLDDRFPFAGKWLFAALLVGGLGYAGISILTDTQQVGEQIAGGVFLFLGLALVIALGFEFVNGFHDTANAVATVIYTNAMPAHLAVVWSGAWNFLGVMASSGAVAYSIVTLLPVDLVLNLGSAGGFAMIFALLLAAVLWNLATWYVGLPNSSSHALIGSILGVGLSYQLLSDGGGSGVDMAQVTKVLSALLISPLIGFAGAFVLLLVMKRLFRKPELYREPAADAPPPVGIRALLIGTCTAVSFAHGGNDGQKGMGLIMLILIGCAPTAYALNRTVPESATPAFVQAATSASAAYAAHGQPMTSVEAARAHVTAALRTKKVADTAVYGGLATLSDDVAERIGGYGSLGKVPAAAVPNLRNDMYLVLDTTKLVTADKGAQATFTDAQVKTLKAYNTELERGTRYIPLWVKITVALALGLGTMVGWRRIVVTVGERIGKTHLTYGMGASAELMAASTILLAERFGMPVSTTHILSSGVAGASVANGAGLQGRTVRNMALAWIMTLPVAMLLSGTLYWLLLNLTKALGY
ncbi:inorganic phosphate transporter [Microvirga sp. SRT01]|uniref:Phosphate transporter n=1 Tax=Sphingomonas longa TaxID=2778730 RepID=A0ABS2D2P1_9SPHN|nr:MULTISPECIES: inorganic phosphate transporter [Alphaproteobacteria]MBM6575175.1 inorganic phosphate transporter [Sphingomonas sp. BT552]MBR7708225.1 inorganic phosphate transporter [Microvirga sp. SRT01]